MADHQKAASQSRMFLLHERVADMFLKIIEKHNKMMDVMDGMVEGNLDKDTVTDEVLNAFIEQGAMPSPAMMSAITKFLKDNEIMFEREKIEEVSAQQRALEERKRQRPNLDNLLAFPAVGNGG
jgi:isocitrate dehydrogenase